jgi:hypothetical protein
MFAGFTNLNRFVIRLMFKVPLICKTALVNVQRVGVAGLAVTPGTLVNPANEVSVPVWVMTGMFADMV